MKLYKKSPLPFLGQKYKMLKHIISVINQIPHRATIVDLFGGSCLLSHYIKRNRPDVSVVCNDFDGFAHRLAVINETNHHISQIKKLITCETDERVNETDKKAVLDYLRHHCDLGFVDLVTIASNIQFGGKTSGTIEQIAKNSMYNKIRKSPYQTADDYLYGLDIVSECAFSLLDKYAQKAVVFIADPPYLDTHDKPYKGGFCRERHGELLKALDGEKFVYFSGCPDVVLGLASDIGVTSLKDSRTVTASSTYNHHTKVKDSVFINIG